MESQFFKTGGVNESPHRFVEILKWEKVICACMISMCKHTFTTMYIGICTCTMYRPSVNV